MRARFLSRAALERGEAEGTDGMISIRPSAKHESENLDLATSQAVDGEVAFVNRVQARTLRIGENEIVASSFHCKRCEGTRASHAAFLVTR